MNIQYRLVVVLSVCLVASAQPQNAQTARAKQFKPPESVRSAAAMLAASSLSAGVVTRLPDDLTDALEAAKREKSSFPGARTAFWVLMAKSPGMTEGAALPFGTQPEDVLDAFVSVNPDRGVVVRRSVNTAVAMLKASDVAACRSSLSRRTRQAHSGNELDDLASQVVEDATGVDVPELLGGSCIGTHTGRHETVQIAAGQTLESALNEIAATFEGTVWVAVDTGHGECSLGLVFTRSDGIGACQRALTDHLGPRLR